VLALELGRLSVVTLFVGLQGWLGSRGSGGGKPSDTRETEDANCGQRSGTSNKVKPRPRRPVYAKNDFV
jgi:hypothetical protein